MLGETQVSRSRVVAPELFRDVAEVHGRDNREAFLEEVTFNRGLKMRTRLAGGKVQAGATAWTEDRRQGRAWCGGNRKWLWSVVRP